MSLLLSIDAGLHGLGCGLFADGVLEAAWYASPAGKGRGPARWRDVVTAGLQPLGDLRVDTVVVEQMEVYDQRSWKGDPADVLEVQGVCGAIAGWTAFAGAELVGYLPKVWKRQVPQDAMAARVDAYLTRRGWNDGRVLPHPASRHHDVMHGIGVGLHHLGLVVGGKSC